MRKKMDNYEAEFPQIPSAPHLSTLQVQWCVLPFTVSGLPLPELHIFSSTSLTIMSS